MPGGSPRERSHHGSPFFPHGGRINPGPVPTCSEKIVTHLKSQREPERIDIMGNLRAASLSLGSRLRRGKVEGKFQGVSSPAGTAASARECRGAADPWLSRKCSLRAASAVMRQSPRSLLARERVLPVA